MKVAVAAFGLLAVLPLSACVRVAETTVRERAANEFACAHYALTVTEVGPDVYRATGCGQELIYACQPTRPQAEDGDFSDQAVMVCERMVE
ncbi:hypothetical protein A7982_12318 [Minicystis rosea]|nr:hypothetical protein A7982_12318 [Minicystis rosea]